MIARPLDDKATTTVDFADPVSKDELEATIRDFRAFMDDPVALLERAADLLKRKRCEVATYVLFIALAAHLWGSALAGSASAAGVGG